MKKSLSVLLSSAIALSSFSAIGFAAGADDFKDLKDLDSTAKNKYDALIKQGVFNGLDKDRFGLNEDMNRAQFAKVAALIFGYNINSSLTVSGFKDVKNTDPANGYALSYIEAIKTAGITKGVTTTEFNPAGKVTREQLATFLIRGLGKESELSTVTAVTDSTVSEWAKKYVALALKYKLISPNKNGLFDGKLNASRDTLVVSSYDTKIIFDDSKNTNLRISETVLSGAKKITLKFNQAIDTAKSTFEVKQQNSLINVIKTTFASDKKSVDLEFANSLPESDYSISVKGISSETLTSNLKVVAEKITKISVSDKAAIVRNSNNQKVAVKYQIFNQYNEDITDAANDVLISSSVANKDESASKPGTAVFNVSSGRFTLNESFNFNIIHRSSGANSSQIVKVSDVAKTDSIELVKVYHPDSKKTLSANSTASEYKILINAKDQYGNAVDPTEFGEDTFLDISNGVVLDVERNGSLDPVYSTITVDGVKYISLQLKKSSSNISSTDLNAGTSAVRITSKSTFKNSSLNITVNDVLKADRIVFSQPSLAVATEKFILPFTAYDSKGDIINEEDALKSSIRLITSAQNTSARFIYDSIAKKVNLEVTTDPSKTERHNLTISAITNANNKYYTQVIDVKEKATPKTISKIMFNNGTQLNSAQLKGDKQIIALNEIEVFDQYGRKINPTWGDVDSQYKVSVQSSNPSNILITTGSATDAITLSAVTIGSSDVTFKLQTGNGKDISNSQYSKSIKVVDASSILSYEIVDVPKLYQMQSDLNKTKVTKGPESNKYQRDLVVNGILSGGEKVTIPRSIQSTINYQVFSTLWDDSTNKLDALRADVVADNVDKKLSLTAVISLDSTKATSTVTKEITYSNVRPSIKSFELKNEGTYGVNLSIKKESENIISIEKSTLTTEVVKEIASKIVKVVDSYGTEVSDTVLKTYNSFISNISAGKTINLVVSNDSFDVTLIAPDNSKSITFTVKVK